MTRTELHEQHISKWAGLLQEAETSGLTIKDWCKIHEIRETTFYYWKRQIQSKSGPEHGLSSPSHMEHPVPHFVELDIHAQKEDTACSHNTERTNLQHPEFLIQFHGCRIAVNRDFHEEDLMKIFRVASHV